jgi:hypothetical protein
MTDLVTDFLGFTSESTNQSGARESFGVPCSEHF